MHTVCKALSCWRSYMKCGHPGPLFLLSGPADLQYSTAQPDTREYVQAEPCLLTVIKLVKGWPASAATSISPCWPLEP